MGLSIRQTNLNRLSKGGRTLHFTTLPDRPPRSTGVPTWILFAAVPVVLILGIVTGVGLAAFRPVVQVSSPTLPSDEVTPSDGTGSQAENPPSVAGNAPPLEVEPPGLIGPDPSEPPPRRSVILPLPVDEWPLNPQQPAIDRPKESEPPNEVKSLVDARGVLAAEFGTFSVEGERFFQVDYQLARDINYNTVLIGIVKIAEYNDWLRAAKTYPNELINWLQTAANRVKPAAEKEQFNLTWTIFEVVSESPFGFLSREVTPMPRGGGYLVTRPLAAVTDVARSTIAISTTELGTGAQTGITTPWSVYGPVLRFDPTDLYRPATPTEGN